MLTEDGIVDSQVPISSDRKIDDQVEGLVEGPGLMRLHILLNSGEANLVRSKSST